MQSFEAQVEALTSLSITSSSSPTQTELSDFLSDGAMEVINAMPQRLKYLCATEDTFNSAAVGSEAKVLKSGQVLSVQRTDGTVLYPCREIPANLAGRAADSTFATGHMESATQTDPVYYIYNGKINSLPATLANGGSASNKYLEINRPAVAYTHDSMDDSVASFPLQYEYLVPLYASIKSLQNAMAAKAGNTDVNSALSAITSKLTTTATNISNAATEIGLAKAEAAEIAAYTDTASGSNIETAADGIAAAVAKFQAASADPSLFGHEYTYESTNGLRKVNDALDLAISYINGDFPNANYDLAQNFADIDAEITNEDTELSSARVQQAQTTMAAIQSSVNIAQAHIADWNAAVSALQSEISGFASEVSSRSSVVGAKVQAVQSYINTANAYLSEAQNNIGLANANASEVQARLSVLTTEYTWMEKQQAKLQADYDRGIQLMRGGPSQ
tara:strand:+ start:25887 stop:27230 length:1344 start_codon:yes stop_codon:yes gene_type:complete